ncbi:MAG: VWA domain-containing protein [Planctomycetota bacterium]
MALLNPALLAGLGLAVIPLLLHLLLRAKPKRLIFPALRLIQQRRRQNVRRMQLRHLWLLLLRMLAIVLVVVAVCRPSLPAANYSLTVREWVKLIVIVVIAAAAYVGVMRWWLRQSVSHTTLLTRRTMLRGGVGAVAILLALVGVAWPYARRVSADIKNPAPRVAENVPVAAIFLFDTSASMSYKQANKTRLRAAQEMAKLHLGRLPSGSKVSVAASGETGPAAFSSDLVAAQSRIDSLDIKSTGLNLNDRLNALFQVHEEDRRRITSEQSSVPTDKRQDRFVREIYVFTDLAKSAWREANSRQLRDELERLSWMGLYVIDVGEESPTNIALTGLKLSREAVPAGGTIRIEAAVSGIGQVKPDQTVELWMNTKRKGTQSIKLEPGAESRVAFFPVEIPAGPFTQGELRLVGSDPMSVDDVLHFSVQTIPSLRVLMVAERPAISEYWLLALKTLNDEHVSSYQTTTATTEQLETKNLDEFDVVCLVNASQPSVAAWTKLKSFVEGGGGLAVFLGASSSALAGNSPERINPDNYQSDAAMVILPARLKAQLTHSPARTMDVRKSQHVFLKQLDEYGALTELGITQVRRFWKVDPVADAAIVSRYEAAGEDDSSGPVALVERRVGQGRVMMMTTGVDGISWNDLPSLESWLYIVFADQLTQYLALQASGKFDHFVGDEVNLPLDRDRKVAKVIVRSPDFKQKLIDVPPESRVLTLRDQTAVGSYKVDSVDQSLDYHKGFSLNLPASESDLKRLETADLDGILGEGRYSVSRDPAILERNVAAGRLGQEMYGMVVAFLVAVFAMEQFTATWFYRTDEA